MPVTFKVASHEADPVFPPSRLAARKNVSFAIAQSASQTEKVEVDQFFRSACSKQWETSRGILQTSVTHEALPTLIPQRNGFVHTVVQAYGNHNHLKIRPDDVWIAILTQLSFYVNAHAEELRAYFVAHDGKRQLTIEIEPLRTDFGHIARQFSQKVQEHVVDSTLVEWILPDFTTSTVHDMTICSIALMSTMKSYFDWRCGITCGLPSVTLEGERADWERLYNRLNRLPELGDEPAQWAAMLRPIVYRFVKAFDGEPDLVFWSHIVNRVDRLCGYDMLSGWITAFCVWDSEGKWLARHRKAPSDAMGSVMTDDGRSYMGPAYMLDGVPYFSLHMDDIPAGCSEVDVLIEDTEYTMVAGNVASRMSASDTSALEGSGALDTLSPASHWFMYAKK
ncbi:hypothetical protein C8Q74DRAFT_1316519 [Fomes fomentarius]|nr:hypothetical protein C8Q74DRAFT_1316519 [Fomes fomentarius]